MHLGYFEMCHFQIIWCLIFWGETSNVVEIIIETLTFEKNAPYQNSPFQNCVHFSLDQF